MSELRDLIVSASLLIVFFSAIVILGQRGKLLAPTVFTYIVLNIIGFTLLVTQGFVGPDALTYHSAAIAQSEIWRGIMPSSENFSAFGLATNSGKQLFTWLLGFLYLIFDANPSIGISLNAFFVSLSVVVIANATYNFDFKNSRKEAAWLAALMPPFLYWTPYVTREALSILLLSLTVLAASKIYSNQNLSGTLLYLCLFVSFIFARAQLTLVVMVSFLLAAVASSESPIRRRENRWIFRYWTVILVALSMSLLNLIYQRFYWKQTSTNLSRHTLENGAPEGGLSRSTQPSAVLLDSGQKFESPNSVIVGDSASDIVTEIFDVVGIFIHLLIDILIMLWGPAPWEWTSQKLFVAGIDGVGYFIIWAIVLLTFFTLRDYRWQTTLLVLSLTPLILGAALTLSNYGIAMRVRVHFLPFLIPLIALSFTSRKMIIRKLKIFMKKDRFNLNFLYIWKKE